MRPTAADLVLQRRAPVVTVPFLGEFIPLEADGHRFLLARDGLWIEARSRWLHVIWPLAQQRQVLIPAGELRQQVTLAFGDEARQLIMRFVDEARIAHPNEVGAICVWDDRTRMMKLMPTQTLSAGVGHLRYRRPMLAEHEQVAIDLHSHGPLGTDFSDTDVADTGAEVVLCGVVGRLPDATELNLALFVCGLQIPVKSDLAEWANRALHEAAAAHS